MFGKKPFCFYRLEGEGGYLEIKSFVKVEVRYIMENSNEKKFYKEKIIEMVEKIENLKILRLIYGFVKGGYKEEKAGSE